MNMNVAIRKSKQQQQGVALVVALIFLLVVTIISVTASRNSSMSLKMASNYQDQNNSLQSAEAALFGALGLSGTANDPFLGVTTWQPFAVVNPLAGINEPDSVAAMVRLEEREAGCPRPRRSGDGGDSADQFKCDYYLVISRHAVDRRAQTDAALGVVKKVLSP